MSTPTNSICAATSMYTCYLHEHLKRPYYAHSKLSIIILGPTRVALHDSQFFVLYWRYAAPHFSLCLKQAVLAPVFLRPPSLKALFLLIGQLLEASGSFWKLAEGDQCTLPNSCR